MPLLPNHVKKLGTVLVQPSLRRIVRDYEFEQAGAIISEDLSSADVILGIKEVCPSDLLPNKTYIFFSHTHKAQSYNMPLLATILRKNIKLVDFELMMRNNKRLVKFGTFAGYAGLIDGFYCLGRRLLGLGYHTPFLNISQSYNYPSLECAKRAVASVGEAIHREGLPKCLCPFTIVVTGTGSVSCGVLEILSLLPNVRVEPNELKTLRGVTNTLYSCIVSRSHHVSGSKSSFAENIAPYTSFLVSGHFWDKNSPRMISIKQANNLSDLWKTNNKMITIADITCDIRGSLEFMSHSSSIDDPYFIVNTKNNTEHQDLEGEGVQIMSVDILPTEFPREASQSFGDALLPILMDKQVIENATIAEGGKLKPKHEWLQKHLKKQIIILGSGFVVAPVVEYLSRFEDTQVTVASQDTPAKLDVNDAEKLKSVISGANVVVSLVPAFLHAKVAEVCIKLKCPLVTASYVSKEMQDLHSKAVDANVCLLNEMGLDPGIDHMFAMQMISKVKEMGGTVTDFSSWCGGLPEAKDNPLGYKFSWNPRGALLASLNPAKFIRNASIVEIDGDDLLDNVEEFNVFGKMESIANRNALDYIEKYGLNVKYLKTMYRGTLRFPGYASVISCIRRLGLLNSNVELHGETWAECLEKINGKNFMNIVGKQQSALEWLGLFSEKPKHRIAFDAICELLQEKLKYKNGERDMVCMHHEVGYTVGGKRDILKKSMLVYGQPDGPSAMAKTVGIPVGIAARLIGNENSLKGVVTAIQVYEPVLAALEKEFQ